ncbi:MAG TPA: hypothetical protein VHL34_24600 [Rhizomicrobium sp.]|jgi:hypothetical protein|nr:hypothetical protein [Rhizomicrobium sp.]
MTDSQKMTSAEPMEPVKVAIIGTGDGGTPLVSGTTATTPSASQPNLVVTIVTPVMAIIVRFINLYLVTLVGLIGAAMTPLGNEVLPAHDFIALVKTCADLSLGAAGFGFLKDLVTIFGKLEGKFPLLTGSV